MTSSQAIIPILTILTGFLILLVPTLNGEDSARVGTLLTAAAMLELIHGFRRASMEDQKSAWSSGVVSLGLGLLLFSSPLLVTQALKYFLAGWFGLDAIRCLSSAVRQSDHRSLRFRRALMGGLWAAIAAVAMLAGDHWLVWIIAVAAAFRVMSSAVGMWISPLLTRESLRETSNLIQALPDDPEIQSMAKKILEEEFARENADRGWIVVYLGTLLAIHLGRMGLDRSALGVVSPGFALAGDIFVALLIAFLCVAPLTLTTNTLLLSLERKGWQWCFAPPTAPLRIPRYALQWLLSIRLRQRIRIRLARCSYFNTVSRAMQIGLPAAAILAATVPVWGMSWYFDTENWAAGIWNSWAEHRTDTWREAMALAVKADKSVTPLPGERLEIHPEGVVEEQDFAFLVIGDPGEGDATQLSLKSQILEVARQPELKFIVISSDVIYPTGAMKDYESRFWLPFMGVTKPVYAIPGNHDWYDALEGFAATFLDPNSARKAMQARVKADNRLTSTTDQHIENLITEATRLQSEYRVPVQRQQLPYFQLQTEKFALFAVDTGVARRIDPEQQQWLEESLIQARGKTKMVILGHPFFAGGRDQTTDDEDFRALRDLLNRHQVQIVMAGDTHDLEYYLEKPEAAGGQPPVLHFVNGGGGAYLSFGTTLDWPANPVTSDWAVYPSRNQVEAKIHATAPWWKRPAWFWVRKFSGWPFSAEWLSAAFDSNVAPFYQSFVVVYVEPSKKQIRLVPCDVHGPLTYGNIMRSRSLGALQQDRIVEWIVPMP